MYQALYRKYRPKELVDVVGQKIIIQTLKNSIINNKISHAYLFTGPRGTGKTSVAKIFAKIVNCTNLIESINPCNSCINCVEINKNQSVDIIEIDAASNNGVEEIRNLRDKVNLVPTFGKYKIYIIDEVHMLTTAAFNALLKTLEEPPKHVIFILATTEPHKVLETIISRCQVFEFKKIGELDIVSRLTYICEQEKIDISNDALNEIAVLSNGGMRDSINMLDQLTSYTSNKITIDDVNNVSGIISDEQMFELIDLIIKKNMSSAFKIINQYNNSGKNLYKIIENLITYLKNVLIYNNDSSFFNDNTFKQNYGNILSNLSSKQIFEYINIFLDTLKTSKTSDNVKLLFELSIIKIFEISRDKGKIELLEKNNTNVEKSSNLIKSTSIQQKETSNDSKNNIEELKKIRINNTLALFDKQELIKFKSDMSKIKELLIDSNYSSIISLILDGNLKAKGKNNIIIVYDIENLVDCFNSSLNNVEQVFKKVFNVDIKPISVSTDEWNNIKNDYNKSIKNNIKKFIYIEEKTVKNKVKPIKNESNNETNDIEQEFSDIIIYE